MTADEVDEMLAANPSLRGMVFGYVAEFKLRKLWFSDATKFADARKPDDHDRRKKGDISFLYQGVELRVESKSLQTDSVKCDGSVWRGRFQCDASDRRTVKIPGNGKLETTCLLVGEFDLLAVNLFAFGQGWKFAFAHNDDLPRTTFEKYKPAHRRHLLATLMPVSWPVESPYQAEPSRLLARIAKEKASR